MRILISDKIADKIKQSIEAGVWEPGVRIPSEKQLCQMFNASRISVRSALQKLAGQGLVKTIKGKGTFVYQSSTEQTVNHIHHQIFEFTITNKSDRINLFEFRKIIEVESAYIAALRADAAIIQALNDSVVRMRNAVTNEDTAKYDAEFHRLIAEATCNPFIIKLYYLLQDAYIQMFFQNVSLLGALGAHAHSKIITAIEMRNGDLAKKYMMEHLNNTMEYTASAGIYI